MTAAAAAVLLQVGRLSGQNLKPTDVRKLLEETGKDPIVPEGADRPLHVGPQIDISAAVERLLARAPQPAPQIIRLGVTLRQNIGNLGAQFVELVNTDNIPLDGPPTIAFTLTGQNTVSPMTFAPDIVGIPEGPGIRYQFRVGDQVISNTRFTRVLPEELLKAAHLPLASPMPRSLTVTYEVFNGVRLLASISKKLTFGPNDGTYDEALAPVAPPLIRVGDGVMVHYDISNVRNLISPQLMVSSINHWSPVGGPLFRPNYLTPLTLKSGSVLIPASAFSAGAGMYGIGIAQRYLGPQMVPTVGEFVPVRVAGAGFDERPQAPTLSSPGSAVLSGPLVNGSHELGIPRGAPQFDVHYDVSNVAGAANAIIEISAPGPTLYGTANMFTNHNGNQRDNNGVDSQSVQFLPQFGRSGIAHFNAETLGLQSSDYYNIRVLAANGARTIGQASPESTLHYRDAYTPGGLPVLDFDVHPESGGVVTTATFDGNGNPIAAFAYPYSASTQQYGPALAADTTGNSLFQTIGFDHTLNANVILFNQWFGTNQFVQAFDAQNGQLVNQATIDNNKFVALAARLDEKRDRVVLVGVEPTTFTNRLVVVTPSTMVLGNPIDVNANVPAPRLYQLLALDESSGNVFFALNIFNDNCVVYPSGIGSYNFTTNALTPFTTTQKCATGLVTDGQGSQVWITTGGAPFTFSNLIPTSSLLYFSQSGLAQNRAVRYEHRSALFPTYDPLHRFLLVAFVAAPDYLENNDSTGVIGLIDPITGQVLKTMSGFNFTGPLLGADPGQDSARGIQIDPSTRTGWTYGADQSEIQQFKY